MFRYTSISRTAITLTGDDLDRASLRRFTFKVKYDYLTEEQVRKSFSHFFGVDVNKSDVAQLSCLAPGDFVVVKKKADILGCLDDRTELINMLKSEMDVKNEPPGSKIGFV